MPREWVTWDWAAERTGCPRASLYVHMRAGRIRHRGVRVRRGALDRASVEEFARWYAEHDAQRRAAEAAAVAARAERDARRAELGPPPAADGDVWLDATTAGLVLGVSAQYVIRLAGAERIPAVRRGRQWWLRRRDVEQVAAARAFAARAQAA